MQRRTPPTSADELTMLTAWLDFHRDTLLDKCEGLDDDQLRQRLEPSTVTLGGLLGHLAFVESYWFRYIMLGESLGEPWAGLDWASDPDAEWHAAEAMNGEQLRDGFVSTCARSDNDLERLLTAPEGLDRLAEVPRGEERVSLRWVLVHLIEEYARHNGHADLVRESIDGATGD